MAKVKKSSKDMVVESSALKLGSVDASAMIENSASADQLVEQTMHSEPDGYPGVLLDGLEHPVTGRGVFAIRALGKAAVSVEAAFLADDGNVLRLPAVFPNRDYALAQIDELRVLINQHFDDIERQAPESSAA